MNRITLQPSPCDRLDPVARAIRWWTDQMLDIAGRPQRRTIAASDVAEGTGRLPRHLAIMLSDTEGFVAEASLPRGLADAHRQALELKLSDLAPVQSEKLSVAATAVRQAQDGATTYALAMARKDTLNKLEDQARKRGAHDVVFAVTEASALDVVSPTAAGQSRSRLIIDASLVLGVAITAVMAVMAWTGRITAEAEQLAGQERTLRSAAIAAENTRREGEVSQQLVERGVLNRRGHSALDALAALNAATPDNAWWRRVVWTPSETTLSLESTDATAAIASLSSAAKGWSLELSGALAAAQEGQAQAFELVARQRQAAAASP